MSYSFTVKAQTRKAAVKLVEEELANVVRAQPVHENDVDAAQQTVVTLLDIVEDPEEGKVLRVQVTGSLSSNEDGTFTSSNLSVSVQTVAAE